MTKIKKIISAITSVALTAALSSCSLLFKEPEKTNAELVLQYIQEKNTDAIYNMLCKKLQETPNIKEQIEQTFSFIEGDVISYETSYSSSIGEWSKDGKAKMSLTRSCSPIETSSGKVYHLVLQYYDENDFEPELVGIYEIYMCENNQENTGTDWFSKELTIS
ncbi:MAG: DUF5104 domain-containing protein [Ruminococcus sp.]|nr:DUF5104 domain-containing protein [Ruminococcus sp.]